MTGAMADRLGGGELHARVELREFGSWMASEQRRIFLLCRRLLQDADEADSATQDVFLKAYRALGKANANELDNPRKWVTRIAVNTCLDRLRSKAWKIWQKRAAAKDEQVILQMVAGGEPDAERQFYAKEIQRRVEAGMNKLAARQRAVFSLRHFEGMALEEIAELLTLDVGTVKAHLFRAVGKMREELKDLHGARTLDSQRAVR